MLQQNSARAGRSFRLPSLPQPLMILMFIALALISFSAAFAFTLYQTGRTQQTSAYATQCSVATAKAENYVAIWKLYGSPTPTITPTPRSTYGAIPPTATATYIAAQNATQVAMLGASFTPSPTPTLYAMVVGNVQRGKSLFNGKGQCYACHAVDPTAAPLTGPSLAYIAEEGGSRVPGLSLEAYLRESIVQPDAYIVPGFASRIMPRDYAQTLTPQDIDDLIAYMLLK